MDFNKIRNIFVTGGTGKIGKLIVKYLIDKNYLLTVLTRSKIVSSNKKLKYIVGDITQNNYNISKCDLIVHLAGVTGMFDQKCKKINFEGTKKLLSKIDKKKKTKFIFFSSIEAYGMTGTDKVSVNKKCHPFCLYGKSKLLAENEIKKYAKNNKNFKYLILRIANVESKKDKDFSKNLTKINKNTMLRFLFSGYEYNIIEIDKLIKIIGKMIEKNLFDNKTVYMTGHEKSVSKMYGVSENKFGMFLGWFVFRFMSLIGRGGKYVYLSYGGIKHPYRRFTRNF